MHERRDPEGCAEGRENTGRGTCNGQPMSASVLAGLRCVGMLDGQVQLSGWQVSGPGHLAWAGGKGTRGGGMREGSEGRRHAWV
jgi:hypothetical protein